MFSLLFSLNPPNIVIRSQSDEDDNDEKQANSAQKFSFYGQL